MADRLVELGSPEFYELLEEIRQADKYAKETGINLDELPGDDEEGEAIGIISPVTEVIVKLDLINCKGLKVEESGLLIRVLYGTKIPNFSIRQLAKALDEDGLNPVRRILENLKKKKRFFHKEIPILGTRKIKNIYYFFENPDQYDKEIAKIPDVIIPKNTLVSNESSPGLTRDHPPTLVPNETTPPNEDLFQVPESNNIQTSILSNTNLSNTNKLSNIEYTIDSNDLTNDINIVSDKEESILRNLHRSESVESGGLGEREERDQIFVYSEQKNQRPTRLPDDWKYPRDYIHKWRDEQFPTLTNDELQIIEDEFKDHWASSGQNNAKKLDWVAAFRNWVRSYMRYNKRYTPHIEDKKQIDARRQPVQNHCRFCQLHNEDPTRKRCPYHQLDRG